MIADEEFRVWAIRECAQMVRGMDSVEDAVAHLESIADRLSLEYIADATDHAEGAAARSFRAWCHAQHFCHHWWEDECSDECDRGEHAGGHGHAGCTDRSTSDSERSTDA